MSAMKVTEPSLEQGAEGAGAAAGAVDRVAVVSVAGRRLALPLHSVERAARLPSEIAPPVPAGTALIGFGTDAGIPLPVIDLAMVLGLKPGPLPPRRREDDERPPAPPRPGALLVVAHEGSRCGLLVDCVEGLEPLAEKRPRPLSSNAGQRFGGNALVLLQENAPPLLRLDMAELMAQPGMLLAESGEDCSVRPAEEHEATLSFLTVRISGRWYAASIDAVQEIAVAPSLEVHPAGIPGLRHRLVLRDERYLVIDLPAAEENAERRRGRPAYGVIMRSALGLYALEAEEIGTVVTLPEREVTVLPAARDAAVLQPVSSSFAGRSGEGEVLVIAPEALPGQPGFDAVFAHEARSSGSRMAAGGGEAGGGAEGEGAAARRPVSLLRLDLGGELYVETASIWQSAVLPADSLFLTAAPPAGALGYLRYRGETALVADLGALVCGRPAPRDRPLLRVIVLRALWGLLAFIVHDIIGIDRLWLERAGTPAAESDGLLGGGRHTRFASARGREGRRMIGIVDIEAVAAELAAAIAA
ncbi:MAG: chemotaxis protein CheW [Pseudomonadota bacterium]